MMSKDIYLKIGTNKIELLAFMTCARMNFFFLERRREKETSPKVSNSKDMVRL